MPAPDTTEDILTVLTFMPATECELVRLTEDEALQLCSMLNFYIRREEQRQRSAPNEITRDYHTRRLRRLHLLEGLLEGGTVLVARTPEEGKVRIDIPF